LRDSQDLPGPKPVRTSIIEDAGQKLKRVREKLGLRFRDVEDASLRIASRHGNDEFGIALSRLSDIENKGTVPSLYRLYSLCAIYRLDFVTVLNWYGVQLSELPVDVGIATIDKTHPLDFQPLDGTTEVPLILDPGLDLSETSFLSRFIHRWGKLPVTLLSAINPRDYRYAMIGATDWSMYPLIAPGSVVIIDPERRRVAESGWTHEFERPIYFLEHRDGYLCGWCHQEGNTLMVMPHPSSQLGPLVFSKMQEEVDLIGEVIGVLTMLGRRRQRPPQP
jgi:transcriptional regulator with XRE-family HTH domain